MYWELTWTSVVFLPKVCNMDLIIRKGQIQIESCYKITYLKYSKMSTSWNKKRKRFRNLPQITEIQQLLQYIILDFLLLWSPLKWKLLSRVTLCNPMDSPWNSPDQNTRVGSCSLLQGIFPPQGSNSGHPHCRQILYQLSHKGSPRILEG